MCLNAEGLYTSMTSEELMLSNRGAGEDSWESLGLQGDQTSQSLRKLTLTIHWKDWCWSWSSNPLATWCKEPVHWKRLWCWERLWAGGEGDDRWDGWMASPTQWTWIGWTLGVGNGQGGLACCGSWGRRESDMSEQLNWTERSKIILLFLFYLLRIQNWQVTLFLPKSIN